MTLSVRTSLNLGTGSVVALLGSLALTAACGDDGNGDGNNTTPDAAVQVDASGGDEADAMQGGEEMTFGNVAVDCERDQIVGPVLPDEAGHYTGTVLTPPSYPFVVEEVHYGLGADEAQCDSSVAHKVFVYVDADGVPDNAPSEVAGYQSYDQPSTDDTEDREVTLTLSTPLTLSEGQVLVVGVEMASPDETNSTCLLSCTGNPSAGKDFWSNAAAEPYSWADLVADFGFPALGAVYAVGTAQ